MTTDRDRLEEIAREIGTDDRLSPDCHNAALYDNCGHPDFDEIREYAMEVATRYAAEKVAHERELVCSECGASECIGLRQSPWTVICRETGFGMKRITRAQYEHEHPEEGSDEDR